MTHAWAAFLKPRSLTTLYLKPVSRYDSAVHSLLLAATRTGIHDTRMTQKTASLSFICLTQRARPVIVLWQRREIATFGNHRCCRGTGMKSIYASPQEKFCNQTHLTGKPSGIPVFLLPSPPGQGGKVKCVMRGQISSLSYIPYLGMRTFTLKILDSLHSCCGLLRNRFSSPCPPRVARSQQINASSFLFFPTEKAEFVIKGMESDNTRAATKPT